MEEKKLKETVQERIRNKVNPFYTLLQLFKEIDNSENNFAINYIIQNKDTLIDSMNKSINYLIKMGEIVDEHLPKDFEINNYLDKSKY